MDSAVLEVVVLRCTRVCGDNDAYWKVIGVETMMLTGR